MCGVAAYHFSQPRIRQLGKVLQQDKELFPAQIQTDKVRRFPLGVCQSL